jgi:hypothetical protein
MDSGGWDEFSKIEELNRQDARVAVRKKRFRANSEPDS